MTDSAITARLIAVGDLQLGDSATCVGFGFRSRVSDQGLRNALQRFALLVGPSDLGFANLETPLSDIGLRRSRRSRQLRGDPAYAGVLRSGGFTVLNVANNHALEHGAEAFQDSVSRVKTLDIAVCGQRGSGVWASQPVVRAVKGLNVGFLGYSMRPTQTDATGRLHAEASGAQIVADVHRLLPDAECIVVSLHWGEEFAEVPSAAEVALAHAIVDAGAAVVLGHHPHVARPVERYRNSVIAYSLGNFAGDMIWYGPHRRGLLLDCDLRAHGVQRARVYRTHVDASCLPSLDMADPVQVAGTVSGLPEAEYTRLARETVQAQRRALYVYTLRNAWRFSPGILYDLAATTLRGKVIRLSGGQRDEIWG